MTVADFTSFPILTTERLTLRQLSLDDKQAIFALRSDPEVNKYLGREESKTTDDAARFINKINDNAKDHNSIYWVITLSGTNQVVGTICLYNFSKEDSSCEIGYELLPAFSRQGIMREAVEKVMEYAFGVLAFQRIVAVSHTGNERSTQLLANFGFLKSSKQYQENPELATFTLTR